MPAYGILNEIAKLSALMATHALSKLLNAPVGVDIFPVEIKTLSEIKNLHHADDLIVGFYIPLAAQVNGVSLLIYPEHSAKVICDNIMQRHEGETSNFSGKEVSALQESATIVVGNFLSAFAVPLHKDKLLHQTPDFNQATYANFIDKVEKVLPKEMDEGLLVKISFQLKHAKVMGWLVFLFNEQEMRLLVDTSIATYM
jgi:chemotaxis protein CheY-P-specific phosphatase CheC